MYYRRTAVRVLMAGAVMLSGFDVVAENEEEKRSSFNSWQSEMINTLGLTDAQQTAATPLFKSYVEKIKNIKAQHEGEEGFSAKRKRFKAFKKANKELDKQLSAVLDKNQMKQLKAIRKERRKNLVH